MQSIAPMLITTKLRAFYGALLFPPVVLNLHAAFAADEHGSADEHGVDMADIADVAAHHEEAGGLPQLDPTWFASQIFWLLITFAVLYFIFSRKILPELSSTIENRHERIQGDLEQAENQKEDAEKVHQAYEDILEEARKTSAELFAAAEKKIKDQTTQAMDKFREKSLASTQAAEANVEKAKKAAMGDMDAIAAEIAAQAAEKIVGIPADIKRAKTVIENINKKAA